MLLALALSWGIIKLAVQQPVLTAHAHVGIRTAVRDHCGYYFERHVTVIPFWIPAGAIVFVILLSPSSSFKQVSELYRVRLALSSP